MEILLIEEDFKKILKNQHVEVSNGSFVGLSTIHRLYKNPVLVSETSFEYKRLYGITEEEVKKILENENENILFLEDGTKIFFVKGRTSHIYHKKRAYREGYRACQWDYELNKKDEDTNCKD